MSNDDTKAVDSFFTEPETALAEVGQSALVMPDPTDLMGMAKFWSRSNIIPSGYQNKPENCFIAVDFARRIGCNALMVMQNLDIIQGKPSWSSKGMTAISNECGRFTPVRYEMSGTEGQDDWGCRAYMTELATGEVLKGVKVTIKMAKDEGWHGKKGSKWQTMPELMLQYRAAAFLIRTHAPELTMGLHTKEERQDMINVTPDRGETAAERAYRESQEVKVAEVME